MRTDITLLATATAVALIATSIRERERERQTEPALPRTGRLAKQQQQQQQQPGPQRRRVWPRRRYCHLMRAENLLFHDSPK